MSTAANCAVRVRSTVAFAMLCFQKQPATPSHGANGRSGISGIGHCRHARSAYWASASRTATGVPSLGTELLQAPTTPRADNGALTSNSRRVRFGASSMGTMLPLTEHGDVD